MSTGHQDDARAIPIGRRGSGDPGGVGGRTPRGGERPDRTRVIPVQPGGSPPPPPPPPPPPKARQREAAPAYRRRRRPGRIIAWVLAAWFVFLVATPLIAWSRVDRVDATPEVSVPSSSGSTYLLVGSDSRGDLSPQEQERLGTGSDAGQRTDSIILVHVPSGDGPRALISIPRDSFLAIPGHGENKVNAAFAFGGPKLLVQTLEQRTGLHIDGYAEIGFAGFAGVVDSLGGVEICVPFDMDDPRANINLTAGCQILDGPNALGYVRARYSDPRGDLGRAERQRQFLGAIMDRAATPPTVLLPWRWWGLTQAASGGLAVGDETSMVDMAQIMLTMRGVSSGQTLSLQAPVANPNAQTSAGSAVLWDDAAADRLFQQLRDGEPLVAPS